MDGQKCHSECHLKWNRRLSAVLNLLLLWVEMNGIEQSTYALQMAGLGFCPFDRDNILW